MFAKVPMRSPVGQLVVTASPVGVVSIEFGSSAGGAPVGSAPAVASQIAQLGVEQLGEYFAGRRRSFDLALDLRGTPFQLLAWGALMRIPFGVTLTYGQQAAAIGRPTAARAVGSANGRNPIPIVVPCHRVVGADSRLGGYSSGRDVKRALLALEGVNGVA